MHARACRDRCAGEAADVPDRVELAVFLVDCRALLAGRQTDTHTLAPEQISALADLAPLRVVPGNLGGPVPGEVARDPFAANDLANEILVVPRESPDAQRAVLSIAARRGDEVFGDAREEKAGVPSARGVGERARVDQDDIRSGPRQVIRGRDPGDATANHGDVGGRIFRQRRLDAGRRFVEPDARHFGYSASGAAAPAESRE